MSLLSGEFFTNYSTVKKKIQRWVVPFDFWIQPANKTIANFKKKKKKQLNSISSLSLCRFFEPKKVYSKHQCSENTKYKHFLLCFWLEQFTYAQKKSQSNFSFDSQNPIFHQKYHLISIYSLLVPNSCWKLFLFSFWLLWSMFLRGERKDTKLLLNLHGVDCLLPLNLLWINF